MSDSSREPGGAEILDALRGMWRQQAELIRGVEGRLESKVSAVETRLSAKLDGLVAVAEGRLSSRLDGLADRLERALGERVARELRDRPVVVHVDMSRVAELEKQVGDIARRTSALEAEIPRR